MSKRLLILERFLPFRLSYASNAVAASIASIYDALFDLAIPEWRLIAICAEHNGITQQQIGQKSSMDKVTVSRAAIALVDRHLLRRLPNPADRRSHLLVLTSAGQALYAQVAPKALELERRIFKQFTAQEIAQFTGFLDRITAGALASIESHEAGEG